MKKTLKLIIIILLAMSMVFGTVATVNAAQYEGSVQNVTDGDHLLNYAWSYENGYLKIVGRWTYPNGLELFWLYQYVPYLRTYCYTWNGYYRDANGKWWYTCHFLDENYRVKDTTYPLYQKRTF